MGRKRYSSKVVTEMVGTEVSAGYEPTASYYLPHLMFSQNRPIFRPFVIREMLTDPRIVFGLWLIKGPILSNAKFTVTSTVAGVQEFVEKTLQTFWRNSAGKMLKGIEWGYSGAEVLYDEEEGMLQLVRCKDFDSPDVQVVTNEGELSGLLVKSNEGGRIYIGGPKAFHFVHLREKHPWYGLSRLFGAHIPWWEKWSDGGYRDIRRLWFYKNSFEGGAIYHPAGNTRLQNGDVVSNKDLARDIVEKKRAGAVITLPNTPSGDGSNARAWEYVPPEPIPVPQGLLEYGEALDVEILEGLGIPSEVIQAAGETGFGSSSGRQIPQLAFFSVLQEILQAIVSDFDEQIMRPLVAINFGDLPQSAYEIIPESLTDTAGGSQQPENPFAPGEEDSIDEDESLVDDEPFSRSQTQKPQKQKKQKSLEK